MNKNRRVVDVCFGISVIFWAVMGVIQSDHDQRWTTVRLGTSTLNFLVGILFLARTAPIKIGSPFDVLISIPSIILSGFAFRFAAPFHLWQLPPTIIFVFGLLLTMVSFLFLGQNFSLIPSLRSIITRGPYSTIRHPAYLGEWVMVSACCMSNLNWKTVLVIPITLVFVVFRIIAEENFLSGYDNYRAYKMATRWRLLPGVW